MFRRENQRYSQTSCSTIQYLEYKKQTEWLEEEWYKVFLEMAEVQE